MISDKQVTLVISYSNTDDENLFISLMSRQLDKYSPGGKTTGSWVSYFILSATYQEQACRGHIQSNVALIVFAIFWTVRLSRHNAISNVEEEQSFVEQQQWDRQTCQTIKLSERPSLTLSIDGPII